MALVGEEGGGRICGQERRGERNLSLIWKGKVARRAQAKSSPSLRGGKEKSYSAYL